MQDTRDRFGPLARTTLCRRCGHELYWHDGLLDDFACCYMGGWPYAHNGGCGCRGFTDRVEPLNRQCPGCGRRLPDGASAHKVYCGPPCRDRRWRALNRERRLAKRRQGYEAVNAKRREQRARQRAESQDGGPPAAGGG